MFQPNSNIRISLSDVSVTEAKFRQRASSCDCSDLVESFQLNGQLQPIVIFPDGELIAGWRRFHAAKELGWNEINAVVVEDNSNPRIIEFIENAHRRGLEWWDNAIAIAKLHEELGGQVVETVRLLGIPDTTLRRELLAAEYALANPTKAKTLSQRDALAIMRTKKKRDEAELTAAIEAEVLEDLGDETPILAGEIFGEGPLQDVESEEGVVPVTTSALSAKGEGKVVVTESPSPLRVVPELLRGDCYEKDWEGRLFNFLHLDPPYGIDVNSRESLISSRSNVEGSYDDSPAEFTRAMNYWLDPKRAPINPDYCSAILWHNPAAWRAVQMTAIQYGWDMMPFPFIWHKTCNRGVIPNPKRDMRRTYEWAAILFRGASMKQNLAASLGVPSKNTGLHTTEKPHAVCAHLLRAMLPAKAKILDPFAGSGNFLAAAAEHIDLIDSVTGIEMNGDFFPGMEAQVKQAFAMAKVSKGVGMDIDLLGE